MTYVVPVRKIETMRPVAAAVDEIVAAPVDREGAIALQGCSFADAYLSRSAEWCLNAVNQCWTQKAPQIRASELDDARKAYDHAREVYRQRMAESEK